MAFILHFLRQGDLFADIGANIGSFTVLAASGAGARVIAFEPGDEAYRWLVQNIALNDLSHLVDAREEAVGSRSGRVSFTANLDTVNHVIAKASVGDAGSVAITTLDEAVGDDCPSAAKIDVEGFETEVLRGAPKTLANSNLRCIVMELNGSGMRYNFDETALRDVMAGHGFREYVYLPFERRLEAKGTNNVCANTIFVRDLPFVQHRLLEAQPFFVHGWKI
jgi:FkbM family methyltransferase